MASAKAALNAVHKAAVFNRRVEVLSRHLAGIIPTGGKVLDLGAGDGSIAHALMTLRPDLAVEGVDVLLRPQTLIPVTLYDGVTLPHPDDAFEYVTIVDVLHHTDDPAAVLREAARVASRGVVIKDHLVQGPGARTTLRFMDWVGNRGHDVRLPYNYLTPTEWQRAFAAANLLEVRRVAALNLYPAPFTWLFDRSLHFVALLAPQT
ncbi:methyltransferase type 11 [Devosia sp. 17-2-E-8]|nr:methyltransferase type 11 [Devosia sp. 17-2-E-8]